MNVLLTCAGRRNYLVNYFKGALEGEGKVIATDVQLNAPALVDSDVAIKVPPIYNTNYIDTIIAICKEYNVKVLISLNDLELPLIAKHKKQFKDNGIFAIVSDPSIIDICFDKWKTKQFIENLGLKTPKTYLTLKDANEALKRKEIHFPLVIKPRWGSASIGVEYPETTEELKLSYELLALRLSKTILFEASKNNIDQAILIQEKLEGQEYGMDILNDLEGNYIGSFAKMKLGMRDGETDKAMSIYDERFLEVGGVLGKVLKHIGNLDVDIFTNQNGLYILELNPRFGGGYPFTYEAGVNIPKILIELVKGNNDIEKYIAFKPGMAFSKCDRLVQIPIAD